VTAVEAEADQVAPVLMQPTGDLVGSTLPRRWVRPAVPMGDSDCPCGVCGLTPENSLGYAVIAFARYLGLKLIPWQAFVLIHGMELRPDGLPRFRLVLLIVSRQSGKTTLCALLAAFWLFVEQVPLVWGVSAKLSTAKSAWEKAVKLARSDPDLKQLIGSVQTKNGDETLSLVNDCQYKISAANDDAGRGFTVHRLIMDELRRQRSWSAYSAAYSAMRAVPDGQCWAISNAGVADSVVQNTLREQALAQLERDQVDDPIGLFEWSAVGMGPDGGDDVDVADRGAWKASMPSLGYTITERTVLSDLSTDPEPVFLSESLCIPVQSLDAWRTKFAGRWAGTVDPESFAVGQVTIGVDIARDRMSASIGVCGDREDGLTHLEDIETFEDGIEGLQERVIEIAKNQKAPVVLDAYGPAAALVVPLQNAGVKVIGASGNDVCAGCVALADAVLANPQTVRTRGRPDLEKAVLNVERLWRGDQFRWKRSDDEGVSVAPLYAVTLAYLHHRKIKKPKARPRVWGF